jgi:hypothetical protein
VEWVHLNPQAHRVGKEGFYRGPDPASFGLRIMAGVELLTDRHILMAAGYALEDALPDASKLLWSDAVQVLPYSAAQENASNRLISGLRQHLPLALTAFRDRLRAQLPQPE